MKSSRRTFLKQASALSAVPFLLPSKVWAAEVKPSERLTMGFIGTGKQNNHLMNSFIERPNVRIVAVCDVDTTRRTAAQARVNEFYTARPELGSADCAAYNDFLELIARDDIDAVCIATPDHWHAIQTIAALKAGKDVYCEKPLTHNVHEAVEIMKAVKKYKRVLQTGSMQRSMEEFRVACELVRNGAIGKISHVECSFGGPGVPCDLAEEPMEPGLDWEGWVGPGPMRPYNSVLSPRGKHDHFPMWRLYKEYGGGMVCDWGAHHLDIAQWGLDMDESGPIKVEAPADPAAEPERSAEAPTGESPENPEPADGPPADAAAIAATPSTAAPSTDEAREGVSTAAPRTASLGDSAAAFASASTFAFAPMAGGVDHAVIYENGPGSPVIGTATMHMMSPPRRAYFTRQHCDPTP